MGGAKPKKKVNQIVEDAGREDTLGDNLLAKNDKINEDLDEESDEEIEIAKPVQVADEEEDIDQMYIEQKLKNVFKEQEKMQGSKLEKFTSLITGPLDFIRLITVPPASEESWDKLRMTAVPILYFFTLMFLMGFIGNSLTIHKNSTFYTE